MKWGLFLLMFLTSICNAGVFDSVLVFKRVEPDFGLDGFNTIVRAHDVNFSGLKLGIQWLNKYTAGFSYYSIDSKVDDLMDYQGMKVNARLRMGYVAIY